MALGPKWGKNGPEMAKKWDLGSFSIFFGHFWAIFFPISGRGPFSIFQPIFSHFWISARFPFYTRQPDSQSLDLFLRILGTSGRDQDGTWQLAPGTVPLRNPKGASRKACLENHEPDKGPSHTENSIRVAMPAEVCCEVFW